MFYTTEEYMKLRYERFGRQYAQCDDKSRARGVVRGSFFTPL